MSNISNALFIGPVRSLHQSDLEQFSHSGITIDYMSEGFGYGTKPSMVIIESADKNGEAISAFVHQLINQAHRVPLIINNIDGRSENFLTMLKDFHQNQLIRCDLNGLFTAPSTPAEFSEAIETAIKAVRENPPSDENAETKAQDLANMQKVVSLVNARGLLKMGGREPDFMTAVMCTASSPHQADYDHLADLAENIRDVYQSRGINGGVIFGASNVGGMKAFSDRAFQLGMPVYGVSTLELVHSDIYKPYDPSRLKGAFEQLDREGLDKLSYCSVHGNITGRKKEMWKLADFIIIAKGATGTVQETYEFLKYNQADHGNAVPVNMLNIGGHFNHSVKWLNGIGLGTAQGLSVSPDLQGTMAHLDWQVSRYTHPARWVVPLLKCS